ncbi:MAG: DNA polymerase IV [Pseudomonadota bacterium]
MIAFVRMDRFGLAMERQDNPGLAGRPIVLLHSESVPRLVEASPEAESFGLYPGMAWEEARLRCPGLGRLTARPSHYAAQSARLLDPLQEISPDLEPFAAGAAFLDLSACQDYYRHDPDRIGALLLARLAAAGAPAAAVGIGGDKTTARWAAGAAGAGETLVVRPAEAAARLAPLTLDELCGAGPQIAAFLASHGVQTCGDMQRIPISLPARRFGNHGRRLWLMAQGRDPSPVRRHHAPSGAGPLLGRLLPPGSCEADGLIAAFQSLADKLHLRLRREGWQARELRLGLRAPEGWRQEWVTLAEGDDSGLLVAPWRRFLQRHWFGEEVRQIQLLPAPARAAAEQADIFLRRGRGSEPNGRKIRT